MKAASATKVATAVWPVRCMRRVDRRSVRCRRRACCDAPGRSPSQATSTTAAELAVIACPAPNSIPPVGAEFLRYVEERRGGDRGVWRRRLFAQHETHKMAWGWVAQGARTMWIHRERAKEKRPNQPHTHTYQRLFHGCVLKAWLPRPPNQSRSRRRRRRRSRRRARARSASRTGPSTKARGSKRRA